MYGMRPSTTYGLPPSSLSTFTAPPAIAPFSIFVREMAQARRIARTIFSTKRLAGCACVGRGATRAHTCDARGSDQWLLCSCFLAGMLRHQLAQFDGVGAFDSGQFAACLHEEDERF